MAAKCRNETEDAVNEGWNAHDVIANRPKNNIVEHLFRPMVCK
jgi:hypothetical protein